MLDKFEMILDQDEKIEKIFKPYKAKFYFSVMFTAVLTLFIFMIFGVLAVLFPDEGVVVDKIYLLIPIGIFVVCVFFVWLFSMLYYKNLYYAYTNKRVIIRSGVFGVDFKSLDMSMIGAVNVYVSLLDKILCKNTGSIMFGSTASPIGNSQAIGYKFNHIKAPYETCKEVKSFIDNYKKQLQSK